MRPSRLMALASAGACLVAALVPATPAGAAFADVPPGHWAEKAIRYVAADRDWMRDFTDGAFHPDDAIARRHLARAAVLAFAPAETADPAIAFTDLPADDPSYPYANVAVKLGWMTLSSGAFRPAAGATKRDLDRALVRGLGLIEEVRGLDRMATADGSRLARPWAFPYLVLGEELSLFHNYAEEARELLPGSIARRADGAFALWRAATARGTWKIRSLERFRSIALPAMTAERRAAVEFALAYAGYPYVWAGEWYRRSPSGYCCGAQAQGGFDCSGFAWWVLRAPSAGWNPSGARPYPGWALAERSSRDIARAASPRVPFEAALPMDALLFDANGAGTDWQAIDHVGLTLGGGWMIHSSGSRGGVSITWVGDGWWRDRFEWARRVIPAGDVPPVPPPGPGPSPVPTVSPSASPSSSPSASPSPSP